jgi:predicted Zn-dependent protease
MFLRRFALLLSAVLVLSLGACKKDGGGINLFSVSDDVDLGRQVASEIEADPGTYPLLSEAAYPEAYGHIRRIRDAVLNSGEVGYRDVFDWEVKIIRDDAVLNAFCTPGGYIYFYTGLIKFLESEDQLAGVMGHEMAHAALRHSTDQLTQLYGIQLLLGILLGENSSSLADIAASLVVLKFSRNNETQADEYSVRYLCPTEYDARGAARFFEKLQAGGGTSTPEFLSTHPNPDNRVEAITQVWADLGCGEGGTFEARYQDFVNSLP